MKDSNEKFPDYVMRVLPDNLMKMLWNSYQSTMPHITFVYEYGQPTAEHKRQLRKKRKPSPWESNELIDLFSEIKKGAIKRLK